MILCFCLSQIYPSAPLGVEPAFGTGSHVTVLHIDGPQIHVALLVWNKVAHVADTAYRSWPLTQPTWYRALQNHKLWDWYQYDSDRTLDRTLLLLCLLLDFIVKPEVVYGCNIVDYLEMLGQGWGTGILTAVHSEWICHSLQIFSWQVMEVSGLSKSWQWLVCTLSVWLV